VITKKRAMKCITHHHGCDCREYRYQQMEQALKVIHTWASFDLEGKYPDLPELVPVYVINLCDKALGLIKEKNQ